MSIEDEIWDEFNQLSETQIDWSLTGKIDRIDKPQFIWKTSVQVHSDELIEKVIRGEKKWDQVVDDLPKRITGEYYEDEFRKMNRGLLSVFHNPNDATEYLKIKRFPYNEVHCLRCGNEKVYKVEDGKRFKCPKCNYKFTLLVNTIFQNTNLSLVKWFSALVILTSKNKISTVKLGEILKISQKTAWYMANKVKNNINDPFLREVNRGIFEYRPKLE